MSTPVRLRALSATAVAASLALAAIVLPSASVAGPFRALPAPGTSQRVSTSEAGAAGNNNSRQSSMSADGRYIAFVSQATNLTLTPSLFDQVYVKDTVTGAIQLVSVNADGTKAGNNQALEPAISADGRFVAFESSATDLTPSGTSMGLIQIYLRDLTAGTTRLVSLNATGAGGGNSHSHRPAISADGKRVAFDSEATDLVAGANPSKAQVYVADMTSAGPGSVRFASLQDSSRNPMPDLANSAAAHASISADGTTVAFGSRATNLTVDPVPGAAVGQVFVHSLVTGVTRLVSRALDGVNGANRDSHSPSISANGQRIAYVSMALNLSVEAAGGDGMMSQVYVRDLADDRSQLVSIDRSNRKVGDKPSAEAAISSDGETVVFRSEASNLVPVDSRMQGQIYARDLDLGATELVSATTADRAQGGGLLSVEPAVSANGDLVAFASWARALAGDEVDSWCHIYLRHRSGPQVERIGGSDRFAASAAISAQSFLPNAPVAYVASGTVFADALSASAVAGIRGAPVLLVTKDSIPEPIVAELKRLKPQTIIVVGGTATISAGVEASLITYTSSVSRVAGVDRFAVSAGLSQQISRPFATVYVASGAGFPDALSGSAAAGRLGGPVLLVSKDEVPDPVRMVLTTLPPGEIVVLGGENTISNSVVKELKNIAPTTRIGGADRYAVSAAVSAGAFLNDTTTVYVASGAVFPDALSGSAAAIADHAPVLLVTADTIPAPVEAELKRLNPYRIVVLGGPSTVSDGVLEALKAFLRR